MTEEKPSSAYPDPLSPLLALIVRGALESYQSGEVDIEGAILHAAVNGWYEGHIEGEEGQNRRLTKKRIRLLRWQVWPDVSGPGEGHGGRGARRALD
jgi:hypothetical protein